MQTKTNGVPVSERDTDKHATIAAYDEDAVFKKQFGWDVSVQAKALRTYVRTEATGLLTLGYPIVMDDKLIVGYVCEASIEGKGTIELPLHTIEQAAIACDELIRARVRLLTAE